MMKFEHTAYNVNDPEQVAAWYARALDMDIVRASTTGTRAHFLADKDRRMSFEFYRNPEGAIPDHHTISPFTQHVAFVVDDIERARADLLARGCKADGDIATSDVGDRLCYVRDPWGLCLQLVTRVKPLY